MTQPICQLSWWKLFSFLIRGQYLQEASLSPETSGLGAQRGSSIVEPWSMSGAIWRYYEAQDIILYRYSINDFKTD